MALQFRVAGGRIIIFGNTFPYKDALKTLGARWNGADKTWWVSHSEDLLNQLEAIAGNGPITAPPKPTAKSFKVPSLTDAPVPDASGFTVSQLMIEAERAVSMAFPNPVWVIGEIQNLAVRGSNVFLELAEGKAGSHATSTMTVKANIWGTGMTWMTKRHGAEKMAQILVDGTKVRFLARVSLYKDRGQISLTIEDVDPAFTQGALALARAELLKKLRAKGLLTKNRCLIIPAFPLRIALISAKGSRAQTDFEHQLSDGGYPGVLLFIPCPMQGDLVPQGIVSAIKKAEEAAVDLIVITRGGGSAADLRWFDGEEIALAIAHASVPVIAAIGHHDDTCVAEEICHTRQKTPTAAADFVLEIFRSTRTQINEYAHVLARALDREVTRFQRTQASLRERLADSVSQYFARRHERLQVLIGTLDRSFDLLYERQSNTFTQFASSLHHCALTRCMQIGEQVSLLQEQLVRLDPKPWMETGWTQLARAGKPLKSVRDFKPGDTITARLRDGTLDLSVQHATPKPPKTT